MSDIAFKIYMPEKQVLDAKVYRVVLPTGGKTLTVIKGRAPTLVALDMGIVQVLDTNNLPKEEYFIAGGAADIKNDTCTILTEAAVNRKDINLEMVRQMYEEFANPFFKWVMERLELEAAYSSKK